MTCSFVGPRDISNPLTTDAGSEFAGVRASLLGHGSPSAVSAAPQRPCDHPRVSVEPDRRTALRLTAGVGVLLLAGGCSFGQGTPTPFDHQREVDDAARSRAMARSRSLLAVTRQLRSTAPTVTTLLRAMPAVHQAQLQALAGSATPGATPATASVGTSTASAGASAGPPSVASLVALTSATAAANLAEVAAVSPDLAQLITQVAAGQADQADRLAVAASLPLPALTSGTLVARPALQDGVLPSGSVWPSAVSPGSGTASTTPSSTAAVSAAAPTGPVTRTQALVALAGAEQALDYVYGVLTARARAGTRTRVESVWNEHRQRLTLIAAELLAAGSPMPAAPPGYDLGEPPATEAALLDLARTAENGCTAVVLGLVARSDGTLRTQLAAEAVAQARRTRQWQATPEPFPGTAG
jgi:hypothetical protein